MSVLSTRWQLLPTFNTTQDHRPSRFILVCVIRSQSHNDIACSSRSGLCKVEVWRKVTPRRLRACMLTWYSLKFIYELTWCNLLCITAVLWIIACRLKAGVNIITFRCTFISWVLKILLFLYCHCHKGNTYASIMPARVLIFIY